MGKSITDALNPCPKCGRYINRPAVVDGIILNKDYEILLIKRGRDPFKGEYAIPGGFIDWNETAKEAVVREIKEETNLEVEVVDFLNYYDSIKRDKKRRTISLVFICRITGDINNVKAGDDAAEHGWFKVDNLPELAFDHEKIINDFKEYRRL
jgi:8-oxo-dGTP diphosphatase